VSIVHDKIKHTLKWIGHRKHLKKIPAKQKKKDKDLLIFFLKSNKTNFFLNDKIYIKRKNKEETITWL
jgi:hypothetical protein